MVEELLATFTTCLVVKQLHHCLVCQVLNLSVQASENTLTFILKSSDQINMSWIHCFCSVHVWSHYARLQLNNNTLYNSTLFTKVLFMSDI